MIRSVSVRGLTVLGILGTLGVAVPAPARQAAPTAVTRCVDLFGSVEISGDGAEYRRFVRREALGEGRGRAYFRSWSSGKLRKMLAPLLNAYKPSDVRYVSVAYTLAYHGVDVDANAGRMVKFIKASRNRAALDTAGERLETVYRRHPSASVLHDLLIMHGDASIQMGYNQTRIRLFLKEPGVVLKSASTDHAAADELTQALCDLDAGANDPAVGKTLEKMALNADPAIAAMAKRIRIALDHMRNE